MILILVFDCLNVVIWLAYNMWYKLAESLDASFIMFMQDIGIFSMY